MRSGGVSDSIKGKVSEEHQNKTKWDSGGALDSNKRKGSGGES